jgi:hypothetical protein
MKRTALEWLVEELENHYTHIDIKNTVAFDLAKAMEKEQIIDSFFGGYNYEGGEVEEKSEQYYNKTYEQ